MEGGALADCRSRLGLCSCRLVLKPGVYACQEGVVQLGDGFHEQGGSMEVAQASGPDMQGDQAEQAGLAGSIAAGAALHRPQQLGHDVPSLILRVVCPPVCVVPGAEQVLLRCPSGHGGCVGQSDRMPAHSRR